MWGNTTGWIISGIMGALMGFLLAYVAIPPASTPPTNAKVFAITQQPLALPVGPETVVAPGTADGDAGTAYRAAIDDYTLDPNTYEAFKEQPGTFDVKRLAVVPNILKARPFKTCALFSVKPAEIINYENSEPPLDAIYDAGNICCTLGKLYTVQRPGVRTKPKEALQLWEAAFVLGQHLYEERITWLELSDGLGLMTAAGHDLLDYYKEIAKDDDKADAIQKFLDAENDYQHKITDAITILTGVDENQVGQYAGDFFAMAQAAKDSPYANVDRVFRVEAIKHVGNFKFNSSSKGDQRVGPKVLTTLLNQVGLDPTIKAAATAAKELTEQQHNKFG